jgi:AmiR/NasT family two-component response regulator
VLHWPLAGGAKYELSALLHQQAPRMPIVVLCGAKVDANVEHAMGKAGVSAVLSNPVSLQDPRRVLPRLA